MKEKKVKKEQKCNCWPEITSDGKVIHHSTSKLCPIHKRDLKDFIARRNPVINAI